MKNLLITIIVMLVLSVILMKFTAKEYYAKGHKEGYAEAYHNFSAIPLDNIKSVEITLSDTVVTFKNRHYDSNK